VKNSILPLKTHFFDHFFDLKLIIFRHFFDPFLGFLGGYPSPSISAPLVVKKCPKLYIYNIGVAINQPSPSPVFIVKPHKWPKMHPLKSTKGRTRIDTKWYPVNLPDILKLNKNIRTKTGFRFIRGERELVFTSPLLWISPTCNWLNTCNNIIFRFREGRMRVITNISSPVNLPDNWKQKNKKPHKKQ